MGDWRLYDGIAEHYDQAWSGSFVVVARHIRSVIAPNSNDRVLDIGTGTGIVLRVLSEIPDAPRYTVGCDRSAGMLRQARSRVTGLRVLAADATALPFRGNSFDLVTASFVLSHVPDYPKALAEAIHVLKPEGRFVVSNWEPPSDPYSAAWNEELAGAISKQEAERAKAEVAPWEGHFSQHGALEEALARAGFSRIGVETIDVDRELTVEQFLEDRQISSPARLAQHLLGADGWARFCAKAREMFHARFGASFRYSRRALIATARK